MNENTPIANNYVEKVYGRIDRMLKGEFLGEMVDSDIENLQIDQDFENQRQQIEVMSSYQSDQTIEMSLKSARSQIVKYKKEMVLSEKMKSLEEIGRSEVVVS